MAVMEGGSGMREWYEGSQAGSGATSNGLQGATSNGLPAPGAVPQNELVSNQIQVNTVIFCA